jgi:hypothetical protein
MIGAAVESHFYLIVIHIGLEPQLLPMLFMWQCNIRLIFHLWGSIGMSFFAKSHIRL